MGSSQTIGYQAMVYLSVNFLEGCVATSLGAWQVGDNCQD